MSDQAWTPPDPPDEAWAPPDPADDEITPASIAPKASEHLADYRAGTGQHLLPQDASTLDAFNYLRQQETEAMQGKTSSERQVDAVKALPGQIGQAWQSAKNWMSSLFQPKAPEEQAPEYESGLDYQAAKTGKATPKKSDELLVQFSKELAGGPAFGKMVGALTDMGAHAINQNIVGPGITQLAEALPQTRPWIQQLQSTNNAAADFLNGKIAEATKELAPKIGLDENSTGAMLADFVPWFVNIPGAEMGSAEGIAKSVNAAARALELAKVKAASGVMASAPVAGKLAKTAGGIAGAELLRTMGVPIPHGMGDLAGAVGGMMLPEKGVFKSQAIMDNVAAAMLNVPVEDVPYYLRASRDLIPGTSIHDAMANAMESSAAKKIEAANDALADLEPLKGGKPQLVQRKAADGTWLHDTESLPSNQRAIRNNFEQADALGKRAAIVRKQSDAEKVLSDIKTLVGNTAAHVLHGAAVGAGFQEVTSPTGAPQGGEGALLGAFLSAPLAPIAGYAGMEGNRLGAASKALIEKGSKIIDPTQLEGLNQGQREYALKMAAMADPLGARMEVVSPEELRQRKGIPADQPAPFGVYNPDDKSILVNRQALGAAGHEIVHPMQELFGQILGDTDPALMKAFEDTYSKRNNGRAFNSKQEREAEVGRILVEQAPPEAFYGGKKGFDILKQTLRKWTQGNETKINPILNAPYSPQDLEAMRDKFFKVGEMTAATPDVQTKIPDLAAPEPAAPTEPAPTGPASTASTPISPAHDIAIDALKAMGIKAKDAEARVMAADQDLRTAGQPVDLDGLMRGAFKRSVPQRSEVGQPAQNIPDVTAASEAPPDISEVPGVAKEGQPGYYMPSSHPDAIKEAAIKLPDDNVVTGPLHYFAWDRGYENYVAGQPRSEKAKQFMDWRDDFAKNEYGDLKYNTLAGFVTNSGEFLDRAAARDRAKKMGQIPEGSRLENIPGLEAGSFSLGLHYMPSSVDNITDLQPRDRVSIGGITKTLSRVAGDKMFFDDGTTKRFTPDAKVFKWEGKGRRADQNMPGATKQLPDRFYARKDPGHHDAIIDRLTGKVVNRYEGPDPGEYSGSISYDSAQEMADANNAELPPLPPDWTGPHPDAFIPEITRQRPDKTWGIEGPNDTIQGNFATPDEANAALTEAHRRIYQPNEPARLEGPKESPKSNLMIAEDPTNKGKYQVINSKTGKVINYSLPKDVAEGIIERDANPQFMPGGIPIERYGEKQNAASGVKNPESYFFAPRGGSLQDYGRHLTTAEIVPGAKIFEGKSSWHYAHDNNLMDEKIPAVKEITGEDTLRKFDDEWQGVEPGWQVFQKVAQDHLKERGYQGAHWSEEEDLVPEQYQIWDKSIIKGDRPGMKFMPGAPDKDLEAVIHDYTKDAGLKYVPHTNYRPINEQYSKDIADAYGMLEHEPNDPVVKKSYDAFREAIMDQYHALVKHGYTIEPWQGEGQPYKDSADMLRDLRGNKHLFYFPTEKGYGDEGNASMELMHPQLKGSGVFFNGKEALVNDIFRGVHDALGHGTMGWQFGPRGEYNAFLTHASTLPHETWGALANETFGPNSWTNFGPHMRNKEGGLIKPGEEGYLSLPERPFVAQRANFLKFMPAFNETAPNAITSNEVQGMDSRPVSQDEFYALRAEGKQKLQELRDSPRRSMDGFENPQRWNDALNKTYARLQQPWGGATLNPETGGDIKLASNPKGGPYAMSAKDPSQQTIEIPIDADQKTFNAAMNKAKQVFPQLGAMDHYLGAFRDENKGTIDIDPVLVLDKRSDVEAIGAHTRAIGGAFDYSTGDGVYPPHIQTEQGTRVGASGAWDSTFVSGEGVDKRAQIADELGIPDDKHFFEQKPAARQALTDHFKGTGEAQYMPGQKTWDQIAAHLDDEELASVKDFYKKRIIDSFKKLSPEKGVEYAKRGAAGKNWYNDSVNAIRDLLASDIPERRSDTDRFAGLLAALSPNRAVSSDLTHSLQAWAEWERLGRPQDRAEIDDIIARTNVKSGEKETANMPAYLENAFRVLTADDPSKVKLSGPKVDPFFANLRGDMNKVTNDRHMGFYGYGDVQFGARKTPRPGEPGKTRLTQGHKGIAMTAHVRQVAKRLSEISGEQWTPAEVQAAIWTYQLPLQDVAKAMGTTTKQLLQDGLQLSQKELDKVPSFASLMQHEVNQKPAQTIRSNRTNPVPEIGRDEGARPQGGALTPEVDRAIPDLSGQPF